MLLQPINQLLFQEVLKESIRLHFKVSVHNYHGNFISLTTADVYMRQDTFSFVKSQLAMFYVSRKGGTGERAT